MQKSFKEMAKKEGLNIAEDSVKAAIKVVFKLLPEAVKMIQNPTFQAVAMIVVGSLAALEMKALELADGIDGVEG